MLQPYEYSWRNHSIISHQLFKKGSQLIIEKTIIVDCNDNNGNAILWNLFSQMEDYVKHYQKSQYKFQLKGLSINVERIHSKYAFHIQRPLQRVKTLNYYLVENSSFKLPKTRQTFLAILHSYLKTINLNHVVCTSKNIFIKRTWNNTLMFGFNYTSIGIIYKIYNKIDLHRDQFKEIFNYILPEIVTDRCFPFGYELKIRSFCVNLLNIIVDNEIDFFKEEGIPDYLDEKMILKYLQKSNYYFQLLLNQPKIVGLIRKTEITVGIQVMQMLKAILIRTTQQRTIFHQKYSKWSQIVHVFQSPYFQPYCKIFQLQDKVFSQYKELERPSILSLIQLQWQGQLNHAIYLKLGIMNNNPSQNDYILYLIYSSNIQNQPIFQVQNGNGSLEYRHECIRLYRDLYLKMYMSENRVEPVTHAQQLKLAAFFRMSKLLEKQANSLNFLTILDGQSRNIVNISSDNLLLKEFTSKFLFSQQ